MSEVKYRTFIGIVAFDPDEREVAGQTVRNVVLNQTGLKEQAQRISATLWPSHAGVKVGKGDVVILEGKYSTNQGKDGSGNPRTFHNVGVSRILVLGKADEGVKTETTGGSSDDGDDEDAW